MYPYLGEAKGRILKDVFMDYSIQVGTILVLRRPNVLLIGTNCLVTVTKTCLIGMLPSHTNEVNAYIIVTRKKGKVTDVYIHQDYQMP